MILRDFFDDAKHEIDKEKKEGSLRALFKSAFKIKKVLRKQKLNEEIGNVDIIFVLLTNNHSKIFKPIQDNFPDSIAVSDAKVSATDCYKFNHFYPKFFTPIIIWLFTLVGGFFLLNRKKFKAKAVERYCAYYWLIRISILKVVKITQAKKVVLFKGENYQARGIARVLKNKCESVVIQHGLIPEKSAQFGNQLVDKYIVWSNEFKKRLEYNNSDCDILVGGNPKTDTLFDLAREKKKTTTKRILALPNTGESHTSTEDVALLTKCFVSVAKGYPKVTFVLKPHPADTNNRALNILQTFQTTLPDNILWLEKESTINYEDYDILLINNSASGLEAAIFGVPQVVIVESLEQIHVPQYLDYKSAVWVHSEKEIISTIDYIYSKKKVFQKKCKNLVNNFLSYQGQSKDRITKLIKC